MNISPNSYHDPQNQTVNILNFHLYPESEDLLLLDCSSNILEWTIIIYMVCAFQYWVDKNQDPLVWK